jgi:hypothetical protein
VPEKPNDYLGSENQDYGSNAPLTSIHTPIPSQATYRMQTQGTKTEAHPPLKF